MLLKKLKAFHLECFPMGRKPGNYSFTSNWFEVLSLKSPSISGIIKVFYNSDTNSANKSNNKI